MARKVIVFVLLYGVWLLWSGHTEPLLLGLGLASCLLTVVFSSKLGVLDDEGFPLKLAGSMLFYIPWVIRQIVASNIAVAKVVLNPGRIHSHLIHVPVTQKTVIGRVIHANTITVTPGTVSLDVDDEHILVHALTDDAASQESTSDLDERVTRVEQPLRTAGARTKGAA